MTLLAKVLAAGTAVVAPVIGLYVWIDNRFAKKHSVNTQFQVVNNELATLRGTQAKIFDQIRENEQRAQDRHDKVLQAVYDQKKA